jgi:Transposase DDE domain group 1
MGERTQEALRVHFDTRVRLEFHGATLTSDAGLLACRELDAALGLTQAATRHVAERRSGRHGPYPLVSRLRQSVYSRLAGDEDTNDAERLAGDPAMRVVTDRLVSAQQAASTNTLSRFETEVLTQEENVEGLAHLNAAWVAKAMAHTPYRRAILDMDSAESPVYGAQEGTAYNGHFARVCDHPLFCFNQFGDCEGVMLRPGNVHRAQGWQEVLAPIVARYEGAGVRLYVRADAAFASPEIYDDLEEHGLLYAMQLPSHPVLEKEIEPLLKRPVGRPPQKPILWYDDFWYQAASWERPRRVVANVAWHQGELFPRGGFLVTNLWATPEGVVHLYHGRGIAEPWMKEGEYALQWTRLSCPRCVANQVRLQLFILAYNLGNFLRRLTRPKAVMEWSLRSVQLKLVKTGARLVRHARRLVLQMAEVAVPRDVWMAILERMGGLRRVPG